MHLGIFSLMNAFQNITILIVVALATSSFVFFKRSRFRLCLWLLFGAAFFLRFLVADADPFLHDWDERFHALVAKNMITSPFVPMLRTDPIVSYDYTAWCCNHIWLHKQPLFLWQMALSMKFFGVNELALRLPSVLMSALLIFPIFQIGQRLFNIETGYISAFSWAFGYYSIELASGSIGMDHNDTAFLFYTTFSLWAFFEYLHSPIARNVVLVGLFAGCAVLCKWLTGMLVFFGMGLHIFQTGFRSKVIWDMLMAIAMAVTIAAPWQIYTHWRFNQESTYEMAYNARHIFETLENRGEGHGFYWNQLSFQYGSSFNILLIMGLALLLTSIKQKIERLHLFTFALIPYLFFSLVAMTKMVSYVFFIAPMIFIISAQVFSIAFRKMNESGRFFSTLWQGLLLTAIGIYFLRPSEIMAIHIKDKPTKYLAIVDRANKTHNTKVYKRLNALVPEGYVVLNTKPFEDIEAMFYANRNVYSFYFSEEDFHKARTSGRKVAVFKDFVDQSMPEYIKSDPELLIIQNGLR